ncbi:MAG: C25 family cysteine peptidase [Candidatus Eiseniibacteriota bacterium]
MDRTWGAFPRLRTSTFPAPGAALAAFAMVSVLVLGGLAATPGGPSAAWASSAGSGRTGPAGSPIKLIASDATGVTLQFELPAYRVKPVTRPEGSFYHLDAPGLSSNTQEEGRPMLPAHGFLLAYPPGTTPRVTVLEEKSRTVETVAGLEPEPLGKSEFIPDGTGFSPARRFHRDPAFYDGGRPWPAATAELGTPGGLRFQRVVPLRIQPFRYDPARRLLLEVTSATIRVDFVPVRGGRSGGSGTSGGGTGLLRSGLELDPRMEEAPRHDPGFEGVYRTTLANYEAARDFRVRPKRRTPQSLAGATGFGMTPGSRPGAMERATAGAPARTIAGGISGDEWRIRVDTTGVWRVTFSQLRAKGFPLGVSTASLALTRREWAGDLTPPFVRVPVPVRIEEGTTGTAGVFDGDDAVVFYGQSFLDRAHPTELRARFGGGDCYFLSHDAGIPQMPMQEVSANLDHAAPVRPASFPSFRRYKRRFFYNPIPRDTCQQYITWTAPDLDFNWTDTLTTFTPDVDASGTVQFSLGLQGIELFPNEHRLWMRWKRPSDNLITPIATEFLTGQDVIVSDTTFSASLIDAGTNRLEYRGFTPPDTFFPDGGPSGASILFYEVTYSRLYRTFQNRLDLNSSTAEGDIEIDVDGFNAAAAPDVRVFDVTDSTSPRAIVVPTTFIRPTSPSTWAAKFQDVVASGTRHRYFALSAIPTIPDVAIAPASSIALWDATGQPEYLIITGEPFVPAAEALAAHRRTQGFNALVAPETAVYDAFDGGRKSDWAIRRFLEFAYAQWGSRLVLLIGDSSDDPQNFLAVSARDFLPSRLIPGPVGLTLGRELSASEFWFVSDLDGTAPPTLDCVNQEPDLFADMSMGRIPAGTLAEAQGVVDRLIAYDTQDLEGAWRHRALLVPDDPYSYGSFFGEQSPFYCYELGEEVFEKISNNLGRVITQDAGFRDFNAEQYTLRNLFLPVERPVPPGPTCVPVTSGSKYGQTISYSNTTARPRFLTKLGEGSLIVNFQGHGSAIVLAHERVFQASNTAQDAEFLFNEGKPFFFLAFSCHVNQFSDRQEKRFGSDALGETMVLGPRNPARPAAGAIASYASTNFELLPGDQANGENHLNVWLFKSMFVDPPHDSFLGERGARVLLGEAIMAGAVRALGDGGLVGIERRAVQTYCLLGDPATPINTGAPRLFAQVNGQDVATGVRYQPGSQGDSLALVVDLVDESRLDDVQLAINGEGARAIDPSEYSFTPSYPDTLNDGGGRRYLLNWTFRPEPKDVDLTLSARDRYGLATSFSLPLRLETGLFVNGQRIANGDLAPPSGTYQVLISSPAQLAASDIAFNVDGLPVPGSVIEPAATDSSRRLWAVSWPGSYDTGSHEAAVSFPGGASRRMAFLTSIEPKVALRNVFAFPNPFTGAPLGAGTTGAVTFNFTLDSDRSISVLLKVYSVSGSLVYQSVYPASPGYNQVAWDGNDSYGKPVANGAYLYKIVASNGEGLSSIEEGRIARVR